MNRYVKRKTIAQALFLSCCILSFVFCQVRAQGFAKTNASGGVSEVSIESNNVNTSFARIGDVVTVTFFGSSDMAAPHVTIAGHAVKATTISYLQYSASYTMTNTDTEGEIPFTIDYKSLTDSTQTTITSSTDNSKVYFDMTNPTVGLFSHASGTVTAPFTMDISFSEAIKSFDVSRIYVENATLSNFDRSRNNLISVLVTPLHDGDVVLQIPDSTAYDAAGNPNTSSSIWIQKAAFSGLFDKVYPNPASSTMTVKYVPTINATAKISLMSYKGVIVFEKELTLDGVTVTIDVSNIPSGAYMLFTQSKNYSFYTNVMVVH